MAFERKRTRAKSSWPGGCLQPDFFQEVTGMATQDYKANLNCARGYYDTEGARSCRRPHLRPPGSRSHSGADRSCPHSRGQMSIAASQDAATRRAGTSQRASQISNAVNLHFKRTRARGITPTGIQKPYRTATRITSTPSLALLIFAISHLSSISHGSLASAQSLYGSAAATSRGDSTDAHPPFAASMSQYHQASAPADSSPQASASTVSASAACFGGLQTFEKISMSSFENPTGANSAGPSSANGANGNSFGGGILVQQDDQALTSECINLCRSQSNCLSFVIDYNKFECKSYAITQQELQQEFASKFQGARSANGSQSDTLESGAGSASGGSYQASASSNNINLQQLLPSASSNYFEKICLDGVANRNQFSDVCGPGRLWTVERVVDSFLDGFVEKEVTNVNNKDECSKLCLFETQFVCRSADYDQTARLCRLSKEDRRTQPQAMRYVANSARQYLENQCATPGPSSCVYETKRNVGIISMDALKFAQTPQDCQMKCNQEATFNCRSYAFQQQRCFLSGDDSVSLNSNLIKLPQKQGWAFGEKKCLVELCTKGIFSYERITGHTLRSALSSPIDLMMPGASSSVGRSSATDSYESLQVDSSNQLAQNSALAYNSSSSLASAMMMMMTTKQQQEQQETAHRGHPHEDPLQESSSMARHTRSASNLAITEHCRHSCDLGYLNCPAFAIDYKNNRCQRLDRNSQGRHQELVPRDGFAFYEKICLRVPEIMSMCQDKYWIFERVLGYELAPRLYDKSLKFVQSRRDCEEYCLEEKQFQCRSALYNDETSDCKLSRLNRRLALQEGGYYRNFNARISYLENNCVRDHQLERKQCYYEQAKDEPAYPTFTERIEMVASGPGSLAPSEVDPRTGQLQGSMRQHNQPQGGGGQSGSSSTNATVSAAHMRYGSAFCEQLCNDNSKFECHAFGYYASTAQCFLSADDSVSAGDMATTPSTGFRYYEKKCRLGPPSAPNDNSTSAAGGNDEPSQGQPEQPETPPPTANQNPYFQPPRNDASSSPSATPMNEFQPPIGSQDTLQPQPGMFSTPSSDTTGMHNYAPAKPSRDHQRPPSPMTNDSSTSDPDVYKCGLGHSFVYQRISGFEPIGGYLTLLVKDNERPGIVAECSELCKRAYECRAFVVDYQSNQCYAMLENSSVGLLSLRQILGKDYFEGFCVADHLLLTTSGGAAPSASLCRNKTWIVDKIVDQAVVGAQHAKVIPDSDRAQCRQACLEERLLQCKSAMYDSASGECKLYSIDRESTPQMRLVFTKGVDFFENQCQITSASCPYDAIERDMTIITVTKSVQARSTFDCELACNSELGFNCRSYTYLDQYPSLPNMCLLSSDSRSTSLRGSVKEHRRTLYAERNCYYRRPRFPGGGGGSGGVTSSHKYDSAYSPSLFSGGEGETRSPINPLMVDPYAPGPLHHPERTNANAQTSTSITTGTTEQEGHEPPGPALGQGPCEPHQYTFERTFGYDLKLASKERAPIAPTIGIAVGCQQECLRRGDKCQSFVVEYALPYQSCFLLEVQAGANKRALVRSPNSAYFEKVCLPRTGLQLDLPLVTANTINEPSHSHAPLTMLGQHLQQLYQPLGDGGPVIASGPTTNPMTEPLDPLQSLDISPSYSNEPWSLQQAPPPPPPHTSQLPYYLQHQQLLRNYPSRSCAKLWTFERFVNYNFTAPVDKMVEDSLTRAHCETACLNEASFSCRAATYDYSGKLCRLFRNTRRTIMSQFVDLESNSPQQQPASSTSSLVNSHPGTAHVLDTTTDGIQTAATANLDVGVPGAGKRQAGMRQLAAPAATTASGGAQQQAVPTGQPTTAEPLNLSRNIDYLENTCTPEPSSCQYRQVYDQFSPYIDKVNHASSLGDCQRQCDQERLFSCKSVNYDPTSRNCMLVNEDLISLSRSGSVTGGQQQQVLLPKKGTIYSEKGNCEMISVQCNSQEMLVTINFDSPFRGRIMAKGNPEQCFALGDGQTSLQFPIVFGPKCNSRQEGHNTFVNEVVIQQHPVIMTESDKTVRVMCAFEAPDQTITLKNPSLRDNKTAGIDVGAPDSSRTRHDKQQFNSIVSSKAAPPSVMLRILDQSARDASMINLGDDLMLKIQMQMQPEGAKSSALGIFARNLAARSSSGESLLLIDNEGCPVDPQVFPALEVDPKDGKSLFSTFKAFRFPSSGLVNFEVQIRFCPERCQPVDCHKGISATRSRSYGRRRKRQADLDTESGRAAILQSVSLSAGPQMPANPLPSLDSLSTVMKPGKAFEYVRKLMLSGQQEQQEQQRQQPPREEQPGHAEMSNQQHEQQQQQQEQQQQEQQQEQRQPDMSSAVQEAPVDSSPTGPLQHQQNEDFDSHSLQATAPSDGGNPNSSQFSPPDYHQDQVAGGAVPNSDQFVPTVSLVTSERPSITMHVDERVVPAILSSANRGTQLQVDDQLASTRVNFKQLTQAPYGHIQTTPNSSGIEPSTDTPTAGVKAHESARTETSEQAQHGQGFTQTPPDELGQGRGEPIAIPGQSLDSEPAKAGQPPPSGQPLPGGPKDLPLRFSILVGENQMPVSGQPGGQIPPPLIMNSTSTDLDHIVIPGKKGQFEDSELSTTTPMGNYGSDSNYLDAGGRDGGRTRDTSKRNASYEQTFDALPSNSVSSEVNINQGRHRQQQQHRQESEHLSEQGDSIGHQQITAGLESAASSHDCQTESGRSRLQAIIWTGAIVISLNVCLVVLSLALYFRKIHSKQSSHSIIRSSSSSDFGTARSRGLGRLAGTNRVFGSGAGGSGSQWPSVILKSKSTLGTSINAHEHFFCKLNSKPSTSGGGANEFNWPNHSTNSSHSTVSSLASGPLPSTSVRINQMRPSLKSVPFDAHSTIRSCNFDTPASAHLGETDHEKDEYTARYTNNIDVLHSERF